MEIPIRWRWPKKESYLRGVKQPTANLVLTIPRTCSRIPTKSLTNHSRQKSFHFKIRRLLQSLAVKRILWLLLTVATSTASVLMDAASLVNSFANSKKEEGIVLKKSSCPRNRWMEINIASWAVLTLIMKKGNPIMKVSISTRTKITYPTLSSQIRLLLCLHHLCTRLMIIRSMACNWLQNL